jgi:LysM repeat protein
MPLPSRDELRERLAAAFESFGVALTERATQLRRALERRPSVVRAIGIGTAAVMFVGVVIAVVVSQNSGKPPGGPGQLVVPVITSTPRPAERSGTPTVGAPPRPGAPPEPGPAESAERPPPAGVPPPAAGSSAAVPPPSPTAAPPTSPAAAPPTSPAAPTATPSSPGAEPSRPGQPALPTEHRVASGETLAQIALRYDVPFEQIAAESGIADPNRIRVGQRLVIQQKPANVVVIQPGRTLTDYARSSGRRVVDLMRLNPGLTDPNRILAGGRLYV